MDLYTALYITLISKMLRTTYNTDVTKSCPHIGKSCPGCGLFTKLGDGTYK